MIRKIREPREQKDPQNPESRENTKTSFLSGRTLPSGILKMIAGNNS